MAPHLLDHRLIVVTGKGGVGKSTVAAALAVRAARAGRRVLVCELNAQERVAPLLGAPLAGSTARLARPGITTVNLTPAACMREYGILVLKFRTIYEAVFENRVVSRFLRMVPSLPELVLLGKIMHEARAEKHGKPRWDHVIVDGPGTGHAVQMLRIPQALLGTVPPGLLRHDATWMGEWLRDPARTAVGIVTLPEEMPVNEAIELDRQLRDQLRISPAALLVNAMPERRFSADEAERLPGLAGRPSPVGPAAQAGYLQALRAELSSRELARARAALDLPTTVLPLLPSPRWGLDEVERIATAFDSEGQP